jgi:nucleotide-binding universal stress UspA family protein
LNIRRRRPIYAGVSYRTILVHLDASERRRQRLELAFTLAERYDAHLVGLFGLEPFYPPMAPEAAPVLVEDMLRQRREASRAAEEEFRDKMTKEQYTGKSEWRATLGDGFAELHLHARYADLVVAGQPQYHIVMSIGRPVLYVPSAGRFDDCGTRVLVAWNASREAARAVRDALPFLQQAEAAEVVSFGNEASPDPHIAAYLARHDANIIVGAQPTGGIDIGSAILSRATDKAADLLVMGACSHSRLHELVLGGATRTVFKSMTLPTFMSH